MCQQNFTSRQRSLTIIALFLALLTTAGFAQTPQQQEMSAAQRAQLLQLAREQDEKWRTERAAAEVLARRFNLPIRQEFPNGRTMELQRFENGLPIYHVTDNLNAAGTISTNRVWFSGGAGLSLNGNDQTLGIWDAGAIRTTHQEFGGRVTQQSDGATALNSHATHVGGTMVAAGAFQAQARGMASGPSCKPTTRTVM